MKNAFSAFILLTFFGFGNQRVVAQESTLLDNGQMVDFEIVKYNNPETTSFLGVGLWAWPLPMDYDGDGDMDMLVSCPDKPFNGLYFLKIPRENHSLILHHRSDWEMPFGMCRYPT
ncbi:hypothetical protein V8V91_04770 [Algoriphagus halophilus]|uniref:hypothetical protein n=1 Tax=Algoriphagus halophilus TaxID=226505 RepID=UPI00358E82F2